MGAAAYKAADLLHKACIDGDLFKVKFLVENDGYDPQLKDENGDTALNVAAFSGNLDILIYLIQEKHCNPECPGKLNQTPLYNACRKNLDMVKYLVERHGCDPMCKDMNGYSPLFAAVEYDNFSALKYFIEERKCDPKSRGRWDRSLLYFACIIGNLSVVRYLVEEKGGECDFHYQDALGFIPLDAATSSNNASVIEYLKERMGITISPFQPILPPGAVQLQDVKTRIWVPQTLSGTPVQWELQGLCKSISNDVLSYDQCIQVAMRLQMKDDTEAALIFFSNLNVILYYPTVLPDVVFVNPQSLLNIITSVIKYIVYGIGCSHTTDSVLIKARQKGIVCHFKDDYFMPSLLKGLESKDIKELLSKHPDTVAPIAVHYEDRWLECGAFGFLITSLLSSKEWKLAFDELIQPVCVYSNIIKLYYYCYLVTVVDYVSHIEIHIHDDDIQTLQDICPKIVSSVMNSFKVKPKLTFVCPCQSSERHIVKFSTPTVRRKQLVIVCSEVQSRRIKLEEIGINPLIWILDPAEVLKSNYQKLVNGIQNSDALAASLYTSKIIAANIRDMVHAARGKKKNKILLEAIRMAVSISPDAYGNFRSDALSEEPLLQDLLPYIDVHTE
eukprot:Em0023g906a